MKDKITASLMITKREGMENLIVWMEENGFFTAPCSTQHHLCKEGGLAEHSMNVAELMGDLYMESLNHAEVSFDSIIICGLLHDIGKCGQFGKPYYVENYLSKRDKEGNPVRSEAKPYITNAELFNVPHEVRALSIISRYIDLTEEEQFAILYHNGMYGDLKYSLSGKETPLYMLLHFADMWASRVIETSKEVE